MWSHPLHAGTQARADEIIGTLLNDSVDPYPLYDWLREHAPVFRGERLGGE